MSYTKDALIYYADYSLYRSTQIIDFTRSFPLRMRISLEIKHV